jgi:hypothetical protein
MREYDKIPSVVLRRNLSGLYVVSVCSMGFPAFLIVVNRLAKDRNLPHTYFNARRQGEYYNPELQEARKVVATC